MQTEVSDLGHSVGSLAIVGFQAQHRYLVVCENLIEAVDKTCAELEKYGLPVLRLTGSVKNTNEVIDRFDQGSILVTTRAMLFSAAFCRSNVENCQDVVVITYDPFSSRQALDELRQAIWRFRPKPAVTILLNSVRSWKPNF